MHSSASSEPRTEILDRNDLPRGFVSTAWPLAAAALILLMLVRACMPVAPPVAPPPLFDAADAARQANRTALAALRSLPAPPSIAALVDALNGTVISFGSGSDVVPADAAEVLQQAATLISALAPGSQIVLTGHADASGDSASLSLRRAEAVRAALIGHGAPGEALLAAGAGHREAGRLDNRRIEFSAAR